MRTAIAISLAAVLSMMLAPASGQAQSAPSAKEIMEKNFFVSKLPTLRVETNMLLVNERNQTRERKSVNLVKLQPNGIDSKFLVKFSSPNDIKGTSFLQLERSEGEDDLWIYLPALKKSRRLVANNKKDSFVGSDFSYGDILLPKVDLYRHSIIRSEKLDGQDCYVIESIPVNDEVKSNSGYSKKITWVRKDNFLETQVDYFDLSGRILKTQKAADHKKMQDNPERWIAMHREMANKQTNHKTVLKFEKVEPGIAVSDEIYSTRFLERE